MPDVPRGDPGTSPLLSWPPAPCPKDCAAVCFLGLAVASWRAEGMKGTAALLGFAQETSCFDSKKPIISGQGEKVGERSPGAGYASAKS